MSQEMIDRILAQLADGDYADEVKRARDEFFEQVQDLAEDDTSFERLTLCFLNWYVLNREMDGGGGTPLQVFASQPGLSDEERQVCARMAASIHSLFEVIRLGDDGASLKDLFSMETLKVTERRQLAGLERGDLLEARLFPLDDMLVFVNGAFVLHPRVANSIIRQTVERARREGQPGKGEMLSKLRALTFRYCDRYRERVPVEKVFGELS